MSLKFGTNVPMALQVVEAMVKHVELEEVKSYTGGWPDCIYLIYFIFCCCCGALLGRREAAHACGLRQQQQGCSCSLGIHSLAGCSWRAHAACSCTFPATCSAADQKARMKAEKAADRDRKRAEKDK